MKKISKQSYRKRSIIAFSAVCVLFLYGLSFIMYWQFVKGEEFSITVMNQSLWSTSLTASRGTIYDANGKILAQSASVWDVVLEPNSIYANESLGRTEDQTKALMAKELSRILGLDETWVLEQTAKNSYFVYMQKKVEESVKNQILEFMSDYDISSGIRFISNYKRYYPYSDVASTVVGFTGTDNVGLAGIELQYDNELSGTTGVMVSLKNALGEDMPFQYEQLIGAENGYDLVLTIDETVQSICDKYLEEAIEKYNVQKGATAIVMDVETSAIIAMASGNDFDLNDPFTVSDEDVIAAIATLPEDERNAAYTEALYAQWRNKAVSDTYEPGSVFKPVTAAAALDSGAITTDTTFSCYGQYIPYEGEKPIGCWIGKPGHGTQNVIDGLCNSCNPFFMQTAGAMGSSVFFDYFEAFGFTAKTGIDLPGESIGIYHAEEELKPVELATESFGQGLTVTPIQMITAIASIANDGSLATPHVVDKMLDSNGNIVDSTDVAIKRQVVSKEVANTISYALEQNIQSGSASTGAVVGYSVAGKTGTSEKIAQYRTDIANGVENPEMEYIVSFCGYAPADDPKYAVLVYFDQPDKSVESPSGAQQAGPVFASIMSEILPYFGIEQDAKAVEDNELVTATPNVIGMTVSEAKNYIEQNNLKCEVYTGLGENAQYDETDVVQLQIPSPSTNMPTGGKVVISTVEKINTTDMTTVPNFVGMSLDECYALARGADIQLIVYGTEASGKILGQTQSELVGATVRPGTVVKVTFAKFSGVEYYE